MQIYVLFVPAGNTEVVQVDPSATVQDVVTHLKIDSTFKILLEGSDEVAPDQYATTSLKGVDQIWAVAGSKGA